MAWPPKRKATTTSDPGVTNGYRSGLETRVAAELEAKGVEVRYEDPDCRIPYVKPEKPSRYTPDFVLPNGIIVETKGRFLTEDRQKHLLIQAQHPDLDIRFVFSNPNARINKGSPTTYATWCSKRPKPFMFAARSIPDAWLKEPPNGKSIRALRALRKG